MKAIRKSIVALIIIVLIVGIVVATVYISRRSAPSLSLAPTTFVAVQGTDIAFNVYGLESNGIATIYFGDGQEANGSSTLTHAYQNPGRYLVGAQEFVRPASCVNIQRTPNHPSYPRRQRYLWAVDFCSGTFLRQKQEPVGSSCSGR